MLDHRPEVESTWATRELPILVATLRRLDAGEDSAAIEDIGREASLSPRELLAGVRALESADPPYVRAQLAGGWSDERFGGGVISTVSERARRELGAWPSADDLLEQLVAVLAAAADEESEPERKSLLRAAADVLSGMARDIAVNVISARLGRID